jgi:murein DD-endopeptidase MepM/ murein hydrolase activator NlpD
MGKRLTLCLLTLAILLTAVPPTLAAPPSQSEEVVYVVKPGDTLFAIALRFGVTAARITAANSLSNPNLIFVGQRLVIPGTTPTVEPAIVTDRDEGGEREEEPPSTWPQVYAVQPGDTLFSIATRFGLTVTELTVTNGIRNPDYIYVGQQLVIPSASSSAQGGYPEPFAAIELSPVLALQGQTLAVRVRLSQRATLSGDFEGRPLFFTGDDTGGWALVGIHALQDVGIYSLALRAKMEDGTEAVTAANVVVGAVPYGTENIQLAPGRESLLDPELVEAEYVRMVDLWSRFSPRPLWEGTFGLPIASSRITSGFGTRRSYNYGPVNDFHGGTDFGAGGGTPIYAPADGRVVLADELAVRGSAVLIDHGMGVFSGYWHQSGLAVEAGQMVQRGDLIGYVGDTGLVTGAHLHWEMRVGGIAVDPMQWTQTAFP